MRMGFRGLGFRLEFRVWGLGFRVYCCLGLVRVSLVVYGLGFSA